MLTNKDINAIHATAERLRETQPGYADILRRDLERRGAEAVSHDIAILVCNPWLPAYTFPNDYLIKMLHHDPSIMYELAALFYRFQPVDVAAYLMADLVRTVRDGKAV